jgi:hypothetical protein
VPSGTHEGSARAALRNFRNSHSALRSQVTSRVLLQPTDDVADSWRIHISTAKLYQVITLCYVASTAFLRVMRSVECAGRYRPSSIEVAKRARSASALRMAAHMLSNGIISAV